MSAVNDPSGPGGPRRGGTERDERERDERGRPRNDRPRDGLGRPLPRGTAGVPRVPDDLLLPPDETLAEAQRLFDTGRPFHAHEVLEARWKAAPESERDLWQGLAQLAVGMTHAARGNRGGAVTLLRRAVLRLTGYVARPPHGIDVAGLLAWAGALADAQQARDAAAGGAAHDPQPNPRPDPRPPRLRTPADPC